MYIYLVIACTDTRYSLRLFNYYKMSRIHDSQNILYTDESYFFGKNNGPF